MTSYDGTNGAAALLSLERSHLRAANRALRSAREALFFGEEDALLDFLQMAEDEHEAASICAREAQDLMGESSDSSLPTTRKGATP